MSSEKKKSGCLGQIVLFLGLMGLVAWLIGAADQKKKNETPTSRAEEFCGSNGRFLAYKFVQFLVEDKLKAPSTAKFAKYDPSQVMIMDDKCEFVIKGYVDAQNGFGAMLRNDFYVQIKYDTTIGKYKILLLQLGEQFYK